MSVMSFSQPWAAPEIFQPDFLSPGPLNLMDLLAIDAMFLAGPPNYGRSDMTAQELQILARLQTGAESDMIPVGTRNAGAFLYVRHSVDTVGSALAQVIVARGDQMIGEELGVEWLNKTNSPGIVVPSRRIWSYNFDVDGSSVFWARFKVVMWVFFGISLMHELLVFYEKCLTCRELGNVLITPYTFFLFLPSTVLPVFMEVFRTQTNLKVSDFILAVSCMQLLFAVRTIQEGKVLKPFTLIVLTVVQAVSQLFYVMVVVTVFTVVLMCSYGNLFGVRDADLQFFTTGLEYVTNLLTGPPDILDQHYDQSMLGALFLYYVCVFSMFMTFSSLIIATISDAFAESVAVMTEPTPLPVGYVVRKKRSIGWCDTLVYLVSWSMWGTFTPRLYRMFKLAVESSSAELARIQVEDTAGGQDVLFTEATLAEVFSPSTARAIISMFAVEKGEEEEEAPAVGTRKSGRRASAVSHELTAAGGGKPMPEPASDGKIGMSYYSEPAPHATDAMLHALVSEVKELQRAGERREMVVLAALSELKREVEMVKADAKRERRQEDGAARAGAEKSHAPPMGASAPSGARPPKGAVDTPPTGAVDDDQGEMGLVDAGMDARRRVADPKQEPARRLARAQTAYVAFSPHPDFEEGQYKDRFSPFAFAQ